MWIGKVLLMTHANIKKNQYNNLMPFEQYIITHTGSFECWEAAFGKLAPIGHQGCSCRQLVHPHLS